MAHTLPSPQARREIAARALMPERTVLGVYQDPPRHKPSTIARVTRAAVELGHPVPRVERDAA
jgi:DNA-binding LacI/PurR family transcriptional regulator